MYQQIISNIKPELDKAVEFFGREVAKIRTGQASPALVEDVQVDVFGQKMPLKQLAGISCPERRQILIQPWDRTYLDAIQKALAQESTGSSPIVEKEVIRLNLPPLTQEFREKLLKVLGEKEEDAKQVLRKWREEAWGDIQEKTRDGAIREDDKFRGKEELQKLIDEYTAKVEEIARRKEKEMIE